MPLIRFVSKQTKAEFDEFKAARKAERKRQLQAEIDATAARIQAAKATKALSKIQRLQQAVMVSKPMRVLQHYTGKDAPLLASGLAYQAIFALFAALWFTFSILGFVFAGNQRLQNGLVTGVNTFLPGIIGGKNALVSVDTLLNPGVLGWSSVISLLTILLTTVGFVATLRGGLLVLFESTAPKRNFAVQKLIDLGIVIAFGALVVVTAVISVATAAAAQFIFHLLHLPTDNWFAYAVSSVIGLVVVSLLDMVLLMGAVRVIAGINVAGMHLTQVTLVGGFVIGFLQTVGSGLLGAPKDNPLFASFAVLFGLLVFFNIVCQAILVCAAWLQVGRGAEAAVQINQR